METVEEIQETFDAKPSKREVCRRAFSEYLEKRQSENEQTADDPINN